MFILPYRLGCCTMRAKTTLWHVLAALRKPLINPKYVRELVTCEDGGTVSLDWFHGSNSTESGKFEDEAPIILVVHALTGQLHTQAHHRPGNLHQAAQQDHNRKNELSGAAMLAFQCCSFVWACKRGLQHQLLVVWSMAWSCDITSMLLCGSHWPSLCAAAHCRGLPGFLCQMDVQCSACDTMASRGLQL